MEVEMNTNAQLIRKLREDRAWSQEHLAAVAGLSARTIQRVEAEGSASAETRMAIATALDVEVGQLNRSSEPAATVASTAAALPAPAQWGGPGMVERVVWGLLVYVLVMGAFAYNIGKDAALRDGRADCLAKKAENCKFDQPR
jgi:transcriptional regulator with XRE-family HTH domain